MTRRIFFLVFSHLFFFQVAKVITDLINSVSHLFGGRKVVNGFSGKLLHLFPIKTITRRALERFLIRVETNCPKYDSAGEIFYYISRSLLGESVCPAIRYVYPMPFLYDASEAVLSWTYDGSAAPFPSDPSANCNLYESETADYVCVGLGAGYLILEVRKMK